MSQRIGEASNPGPEIWHLAASNPTGLTGKASSFASLDPGIIAVSETHLTDQGLIRFKQELKGSKSNHQVLHGHPVPYRTQSVRSYGGKQLGAGFLSSFPSRPLQAGWQNEIFETCRVAAANFRVGGIWICAHE